MAKHLIDIFIVFVVFFLPMINTYILYKILNFLYNREEGE